MTTDERIEKLEKGLASARRLNRWLLAAVGLALGVWILAGTFGPTMAAAPAGGGAVKEVRANRFVVEDENGKVRAVLAVHRKENSNVPNPPRAPGSLPPPPPLFDKDYMRLETTLELFDVNGKVRICMGVAQSEGGGLFGPLQTGLYLFGASGKDHANLTTNTSGASLSLSDENGTYTAALAAHEGGMGLNLIGRENLLNAAAAGRLPAITRLNVDKDGAVLNLSDKNGMIRAALGRTETKTPDGRAITYPESSLLLFNPEGKVTWQAP
jgi:hypothetical protein